MAGNSPQSPYGLLHRGRPDAILALTPTFHKVRCGKRLRRVSPEALRFRGGAVSELPLLLNPQPLNPTLGCYILGEWKVRHRPPNAIVASPSAGVFVSIGAVGRGRNRHTNKSARLLLPISRTKRASLNWRTR